MANIIQTVERFTIQNIASKCLEFLMENLVQNDSVLKETGEIIVNTSNDLEIQGSTDHVSLLVLIMAVMELITLPLSRFLPFSLAL
jgi:hypothetical protein